MRRRWAGLLAAPLVAGATPSGAEEASRATVHALASHAAAGDPTSLARLRAVTSVDGVPIALGRALDVSSTGSDPADLSRRLARLLAATGSPSPAGAGAAEPAAEAHGILSSDRYAGTSLPRPLHGILRVLGEDVVRPVVRALDRLVPGSASVVWALLGLLVVAAAIALAALLVRHRRPGARPDRRASEVAARPNAEALERDADAAERRGELERALRLRLQAGLLRLDRQGAIELRDSTTTGQVAESLGSDAFADVARRHGEVVYGGRAAVEDDLAATRRALAAGAGRRPSGQERDA